MFYPCRPKILVEFSVGCILLLFSFFVFAQYDVLEKIVEWSRAHEDYEVDELLSTSIVLMLLCLIFAARRYNESTEKTKKLQKALTEVKTLKGIISICSYCKCIRNDEGSWSQLETYLETHSGADFSHGICPYCYDRQMHEIEARNNSNSVE